MIQIELSALRANLPKDRDAKP